MSEYLTRPMRAAGNTPRQQTQPIAEDDALRQRLGLPPLTKGDLKRVVASRLPMRDALAALRQEALRARAQHDRAPQPDRTVGGVPLWTR